MRKAAVSIRPDAAIGDTDPRLFGAFVEHVGRCVYGGLYEPGHPTADRHGFRGDVLALVRELAPAMVRYPGGNFVSGYNWEDGVGPREQRPRRLDLAWLSTETNQFGTNEFIDWCRAAGAEPMLAVNLGTRRGDAARNLLEYCNHPGDTAWSDLRRRHGWEQPHGVKFWCLGNEMDGPWQMETKTAEEYGRIAAEAAKLMKWLQTDLQLAACGSSSRNMPTFGAWEDTVLQHTGGTCIALLNHADRVKAACLAQLVNAIAPIMTETGGAAWRQTIFHPFVHMSRHGRGRVLRAHVDCETYAATYYDPRGPLDHFFPIPAAPYLKLAAVQRAADGGLTLFALNRDLAQPMEVDVALPGYGTPVLIEALQLCDADLQAANTRDAPQRVAPGPLREVAPAADRVRLTLPPASWNVIRLARATSASGGG